MTNLLSPDLGLVIIESESLNSFGVESDFVKVVIEAMEQTK
jgi:hypothetical protein